MSCDNLTEVRRPQERKVLLFPLKKKTPESCHTARTTTKETNQTEQRMWIFSMNLLSCTPSKTVIFQILNYVSFSTVAKCMEYAEN